MNLVWFSSFSRARAHAVRALFVRNALVNYMRDLDTYLEKSRHGGNLAKSAESVGISSTSASCVCFSLAGLNLILCYYALGDQDKMKRGFNQLLAVPEFGEITRHDEEMESRHVAQGDKTKRMSLTRAWT